MAVSGFQILLLGLLLICLASFTWGMRKFFLRPAGMTPGMKVVNVLGASCAVLHVVAILTTGSIDLNRTLGGAAIYLSALALFWWAIRTNAKAPLSAIFSPDHPAHLVDSGPYRFIRHPLYCSYLLVWLAGCVATARLWLLLPLVVMLALYVVAARAEENKFRASPFAAAYQRYRDRTGQLVPNPVKMLVRRST